MMDPWEYGTVHTCGFKDLYGTKRVCNIADGLALPNPARLALRDVSRLKTANPPVRKVFSRPEGSWL